MKRAPRNKALVHNLAVLYLRQRKWKLALVEYGAERRISPHSIRAMAGISECLQYLGRYEEDLKALSTLLVSQDVPEWALLDAGSANQHLGHLESAIFAYKRAEKQDPMNATAHYHLMQLYKTAGDDELARRESRAFMHLKAMNPGKE